MSAIAKDDLVEFDDDTGTVRATVYAVQPPWGTHEGFALVTLDGWPPEIVQCVDLSQLRKVVA